MNLDLIGIFGAGIATFVTPCVLPLVPIYLSALVGGDLRAANTGRRGALLGRAALFALGFVAVFTVLGLTASSLGSALARHQYVLQGVGAVLILVFGLKFLGVIRIPFMDRVLQGNDQRFQTRFGSLNAVVMGVVFAAGWTPCVGPVLGSVLTYTASASSSPWTGAGYLAVYGLGFAVPLLLTAAFAEAGIRLLDRIKPHLGRIERVVGVLLVVVALSMAADAFRSARTPPVKADWTVQVTTAANGKRLPAMVELYSDDCPICQKMKPVVASLSRQCHGKKVLVRKFNVTQREHRGLVKKFRLVGVPTFVFLDKDGQEVARLVGKQSAGSLRQALSALRGESCPGIGALPDARRDAALAFPRPQKPKEVESCPSTNTTATTVTENSNPSSPSASGTKPTARSAADAPAACSADSP